MPDPRVAARVTCRAGSFAEIPLESDMGHLLVSVSGTPQAEEAVMENQIPQTAAIKRDATIEVEYDGEPVFEPIEGTEMTYAVNTSAAVIFSAATRASSSSSSSPTWRSVHAISPS